MSVPLENHLVQCLKNISNKYLKQFENSFFVPLTSSIAIDLEDLTKPQNLNLNLNQIPPPNPVTFPLKPQGEIQEKLEELFDFCQYVGMNEEISNQQLKDETDLNIQKLESQIENIQEEILMIDLRLERLDRDDDQFFVEMQNKIILTGDLKKAKQEQQKYVNQNLHLIVEFYRTVVEDVILQQNSGFFVTVFNSSSYRNIYSPQNQVFSEFNYNSSYDEIMPSQNSNYEQLQADVLKNFGIGELQNESRLQQSIQEAFDQIVIQCESSSVYFKRKWLPLEILKNQQVGLKDKQINQWSNGKQREQEANAEFPYIIVGAVICRNIQIEGLKTDKKSVRALARIQTDGDSSSVLIFKLQNETQQIQEKDYIISLNPPRINIKSPKIIGFILQPLNPFPLVVHQQEILLRPQRQFPYKEVEEEIKQLLESNSPEDEIIQCYDEDERVNFFPNWRAEIQSIIRKLINPNVEPEPIIVIKEIELPEFKDFQQKSNLIKRFLNNEQRIKDKDFTEPKLKLLYKQLTKNEILIFMDYYENNNVITNTLESVFEEEEKQFKEIVTMKKQQNQDINFVEISRQLLIKKEVLENLYETIFEPLPLQIHAAIEQKREEIIEMIESTDQQLLDYYQNDKSLLKIPRWKEQIKKIIQQERDNIIPIIKVDIQDVLIQKQDEIQQYLNEGLTIEIILEILSKDNILTHFEDWQDNVLQLINKNNMPEPEPEIPGMQQILEPIQNYQQKQKFIDHLKQNQHMTTNFHDIAKQSLYGVSGQKYKDYCAYYEQFQCITNREDNILNEERQILDQQKLDNQQIDVDQISQRTLIHPQVLRDYFSIFEIHQSIIEEEQNIKFYLSQELDVNVIIECYKDDLKINRISKWRKQLEKFIEDIKEEMQAPLSLPQIENYIQKQILIVKIKSGKINDDLKLQNKDFEQEYKELKKEVARKCYRYYQDKGGILTNSRDEIMEDEINECFQKFFMSYGEPTNFIKMSYETLISQQILEQLYEDFQKVPINIPIEIQEYKKDILDMKDSEMGRDDILDHYQQNDIEIQKIQNWRIFLSIFIDRLDPQDFITINPDIILPQPEPQIFQIQFQNYQQKQMMIQMLKQNEFQKGKNYPPQVLDKKYEKLTNEQIQVYLMIYEQNNQIITLKNEELMPEEKVQIIESLKSTDNFKELSIKYMVHESIIKQIYNNEIFDDELIKIFQEFLQQKNSQQIKELLSQQHEQARVVLIDIFKHDSEKYQKVIDICQNNAFSYLLQNQVTNFFKILSDKNEQNLQNEINTLLNIDPILLLKIFNKLDQLNRGNVEEEKQQDKDPFRITERETKIIDVNNNTDLITVAVKAFQVVNQQNKNKAIAQLEQFEVFSNFVLDQYPDYQKKLLFHEFLSIEKNQNINQNQKYQQFEQLIIHNHFDLIEKNALAYSNLKEYLKQQEEIQLYTINIEQKNNQQNNKPNNQIYQLQKNLSDQNFQNLQNNNNNEQEIILNQNEDLNNNNITQTLSELLKRSIVLHKSENISEYKIFGEQFLNQENLSNCIHLVLDSKNKKYSILYVDHSKIIANQIHVQSFKQNHPNIYDILQPWFREFMGFRSFYKFIYNKNEKQYIPQNIKMLQNLVANYNKYEENMNELQFIELVNSCAALSDQLLFQEWYANIIKSDFGKDFSKEFDNYWAKTNASKQSLVQEQIKLLFPNPSNPLDLRDFNRLRGRKDKNELMKKLEVVKEKSPVQFVHEVIQQIFGFINRRENISTLIDQIKELQIYDQISSRFFISLIFQRSNMELRSRLIYYLSEYFSVPLIMVCQSSYKSKEQNLIYVPEIALQMLEGMGIFNFGAGKKCLQKTGKSQLLNDILFPVSDFGHKAFEECDDNIFSNGQIDVFFEKSFEKKRNIVILDGQGNLNNQAISSALKLTNIALINFNNSDFNNIDAVNDLYQKLEIIRLSDVNIYKILVIRDHLKSELYQQKLSILVSDKKNTQIIFLVDKIQSMIDQCVTIKNLKGKEKSQRLIELKVIMQTFNYKIKDQKQNVQQHKFTKENFITKFMVDDTSENDNFKNLQHILKESEDFIKELETIKNNIFQDNALPILQLKSLLRKKNLEIRNKRSLNGDESLKLQEKLEKELETIQKELNSKEPTNILKSFHKIIIDENSSLILLEISKRLRQECTQQVKEPNNKKEELIKDNQEQAKKNHNSTKDEIDERNKIFQDKIDKLNQEIYEKSISLEYFWRSIVFYLESETQIDTFKNKVEKNNIVLNIDNLLKNGDCFELIDGENLEFKGQFIKDVIETCKKDRVIVVCVIGPQSSGKSTLMNFAFGTQFFTSTGRCTKGIYFTLQKFPEDIKNNSQVKWLLMLDTEGLQSPERIDDEYDRKIVLFAMLSANLLIINNKGEINAQMVNTLKMCCLTFDMLKKFGFSPQIIYTYGQNDNQEKLPFRDQVQNLRQEVILASNSPTIEKTSEELLGYNEDKINVFGNAYTTHVIQKEESKGLDIDNHFKIGLPNFGVQTSIIFQKVCDIVAQNSLKFFEIGHWLEESKQNWQLIDKYSGNINAFKNLEEYKNEQKVQKKMYDLWNDYKLSKEVDKNDEIKCTFQRNILLQILNKKQGQNELEQKIQEIIKQNDQEKENHLDEYIFREFEKWKNDPDQKSITVDSVDKYKKDIKGKMEVIKSDFKVKLRSQIKEEQMVFINQNGIKNIQETALLIQKDNVFQQMNDDQKKDHIKQKFDQCWVEQLQNMQKQAEIKQMIQNYFNDLLQTFKVYNKFIRQVNQADYENLYIAVDLQLRKDQKSKIINIDTLQQFLVSILATSQDDRIFGSNNEMIFYLKEDIRERIFDPMKKEEYLKLQELIECTYSYFIISNDLQSDLNKQLLFQDVILNLNKQKSEIIQKKQYNQFKDEYNNEFVKKIDDIEFQKSYLQTLFKDLEDAGFQYKYSSYYIKQKLTETDIQYLFETQFKSYLYQGKDGVEYNKKLKEGFAKVFVNNLEYINKNFQSISPKLEKYFNKNKIQIANRSSPLETIQFHKSIDIMQYDQLNEKEQQEYDIKKLDKKQKKTLQEEINKLKSAKNIQQEAVITYQQSKTAKNIKQYIFNTFIYPKTSENDMISKQKNLSFIAHKQMEWRIISDQIVNSVKLILKNQVDDDSESQSNNNQEIQEVMELKQMSYQQIMTLENVYLGSKLREKIDYELQSKLGLKLSHEMSAQISWCALVTCWILLFYKAEKTFNKQMDSFEKNYDTYFESFKQIIEGNLLSITKQNAISIFQLSYKNIVLQIKQQYKVSIMNEITNIQMKHFKAPAIYKELDQFYFALQYKAEQKAFIDYVHNPVKIFEEKVLKLKGLNLDPLIENYGRQIQQVFQQNLLVLQNLFGLLQNLKNQVSDRWGVVGKYFKITDDQNKPLTFNQIDWLMNQISPIVYLVFMRILDGNFSMDTFEYSLLDENGIQQDYYITPNSSSEDGPLEVFTGIKVVLQIQQIIQNDQNNILLNELKKIIKEKQNDSKYQLNHIDVIIDVFYEEILKHTNKNLNEIQFNEQWFECQNQIDDLMKNAVGCISTCQFCNRKCELQPHNTQDTPHSCDNVGHQLRVFAGGQYVNKKGEKFPSLGTCDTIKQDRVMLVDGQKSTWQDVLQNSMRTWVVNFKEGDLKVKENLKMFQLFWETVGKDYCSERGIIYDDKNPSIEQNQSYYQKDSGVIIIALDESGSMGGIPWNDVVQGAKKLIEFIIADHAQPQDVQIIIIFFGSNARLILDDQISNPIDENIWVMNGGGTYFGPPMKLAFEKIEKYIDTKQQAKFYFFTDGGASYPQSEMQFIEQMIENKNQNFLNQNGENKLEILLMCQDKNNLTMEAIQKKFNEISQNHLNGDICKLLTEVDTSKVGDFMIESFNFAKVNK